MAKKTRKVEHYEVYTLRKTTVKVIREEEHELLEDIVVFDDKVLGEAYIAKLEANPNKEKGVKSESYLLHPSWVELKPSAENYSLPFNLKKIPVDKPVKDKSLVGKTIKSKTK